MGTERTTLGDLIALVYEHTYQITNDAQTAAQLAGKIVLRVLTRSGNLDLARTLLADPGV